MARHSHWANIKRQKAVTDGARAKVFTRHARLVEIAAREGGSSDPEKNSRLAMAIDAARADNVPKENIERAAQKGVGSVGGDSMAERVYEAYGPAGVALLIVALTDNVTRTIANVRHILSKNGGKIASPGSVAFQFRQVGVLRVRMSATLEESAIEALAQDIEAGGEEALVITAPTDLMRVRGVLVERGEQVLSSELSYVPENSVEVAGEDEVALEKLIELLEEDSDVSTIYTNCVRA